MAKAVFGIIIMGLLMISSCTKTTPDTDGSWTFEGTTYPATSYANSLNSVSLSSDISANEANYPAFLCTFNHVLPTVSGTYTVCGTAYPDSAFVSIAINTGGAAPVYYNSTGGNGNETITATVSSGLLKISGSGIEMVNSANHSDSSTLSFSIFQPN